MNDVERRAARLANQNRAVARKRELINSERQKPCTDCGLVEPEIMQFDHVPGRGKKLFSLGAALSGGKGNYWSRDQILAEIAKCDIVCPNCHARRGVRRTAQE